MQTRVFLIGFMGSGKTTMGSKLARAMGYEFVDMDQLIEQTAGMTVAGIFSDLGEEVFRKWEQDILQELCLREKVVVATGGGAPCHGTMMSTMNSKGDTVYINLSPETLLERLTQSKVDRPLIRGKSKDELLHFITSLLETRESFYNQARYIVDGISLDPERLAIYLKRS
jgi:shikimate kinase